MKNIDKYIVSIITNSTISNSRILEFVKQNYTNIKLKPKTLGMILEVYIDEIGWQNKEEFLSPEILIEDLLKINVGYQSENGCQWARSDNSYLGKKYKIVRKLNKGKVYSVQLNGANDSQKRNRAIRKDIVEELSTKRCVVLDIGTQIEIDHKNGRYDDENVACMDKQTLDFFQAMSKAVNDAKRQHCKDCQQCHKRYDAKRLGYKVGWFVGDEDTNDCVGCYWHDPFEFNKKISQNFNSN